MKLPKIKLFNLVTSLVTALTVIGIAAFFRNSNAILAGNISQINSLITEIGDIKEENQILKDGIAQQINEKNQLIDDLRNENNQKSIKLSTLTNYQSYIQDQQRNLINSNNNLNSQINQKDQQIEDLQLKKDLAKLNEEIFSILLLGENQKLTDTIMLLTFNPSKKLISLISIPRDLFHNGRKINEYNKFYGIEKSKEVIEEITGIKANKYIQLDFQAFEKIIDSLDGVTIQIDQDLIDHEFPGKNNSYQTVSFKKGIENMTGQRALQYARSRKSSSDFDRSLRQQKIILAVKEKVKKLDLMKNIQFYIDLYQNLTPNLKTDFNVLEAVQTFEKYKDFAISAGNIINNQNFLYSSTSVKGQSILLPREKNYKSLKEKILEII